MLARLCQLKSRLFLVALLVISSCSWRKNVYAPELVTTFPNRWYSVSSTNTLLDQNLIPASHAFFDTSPDFQSSNQLVNIVIATPEQSEHAYAIDLQSGQRYFTHSFCPQKDAWNEFGGKLFRPGFSVGHIPKVLDQIGEPQKVVVWSSKQKMLEIATTNFHKVRLVGAYVEQICPEVNCLGKSNWLSRLVFLAVDDEDPHYQSVKNVADFSREINWKKAKAMLGNMEGRNFRGDSTYPNTRIGGLIEFREAYDYFIKRSIFLTDTELKKIQKSCHSLYDALWDEVGKQKPEDKPANTMKELEEKVKLREVLRKEGKPVGFSARFRAFTKKYFNEVTTCEKFVYHGNINQDTERFWFLSFVGIYYRLHREGYYFDCRNKAWLRNAPDENGNPLYDFKKGIDQCGDRELDKAMDYLPNFLAGLKVEKEYYKFIDYDNHPFGSHKKIYTWVRVKNRRFDCSNDPNVKVTLETKVFPVDIVWKERAIKDIADKEKIIY